MGIGWIYFDHLERQGIFGDGNKRVLDIGAQHIFDIPVEAGMSFLRRYGCTLDDGALRRRVETLSKRSPWPPKKNSRPVFLGEFLEVTTLDYTAFDIFAGPGITIFDFNSTALPKEQHEQFDIVFNFGTTEHILNQFNCFRVIHDACRPGAYIFHQVPCMGFLDHGYWIYSPRLFIELAEMNAYEVCQFWCSGPLGSSKLFDVITYPMVHDRSLPQNAVDVWEQTPINNGLINALLRKRVSSPFRLSLDISTSGSGVQDQIMQQYVPPQSADRSKGARSLLLRQYYGRELARELWYRVMRRLRLAK